jgi:hypothetical protein
MRPAYERISSSIDMTKPRSTHLHYSIIRNVVAHIHITKYRLVIRCLIRCLEHFDLILGRSNGSPLTGFLRRHYIKDIISLHLATLQD